MSTTVNEEMVLAALNDLGSTVDDVAATLTAGGFKGYQSYAESCPVANYVSARFPGWSIATWRHVMLDSGDSDERVDVETPKPVFEFILAFDDSKYPALVARGLDEVS